MPFWSGTLETLPRYVFHHRVPDVLSIRTNVVQSAIFFSASRFLSFLRFTPSFLFCPPFLPNFSSVLFSVFPPFLSIACFFLPLLQFPAAGF